MRLTPAEFGELRDLVMRVWDPIGVDEPGNDPDERALYWGEYDSYLPTIVGYLRRGEGVEPLSVYLAKVRTVDIGLSANIARDVEAAGAIVAWYSAARPR